MVSTTPLRQQQALHRIVAELGDRLELLSPSDYQAVRETESRSLPSMTSIWELFGGFHRMRECAVLVAGEAA